MARRKTAVLPALPGTRRRRRLAVCCAVLVMVGGVPYAASFWPRAWLFDLYQRVDPPRRDPSQITIIDIDDESVRRLGRWPWPRERLAAIVSKARAARVVGMDILLLDADQAASDARLAAAIDAAPVVLAATGDETSPAETISVTPILQSGSDAQPFVPAVAHVAWPLPAIGRGASGTGLALVLPERDGIVRRLPTVFATGSTLLPSFAMEVLRVADRETLLRIGSSPSGVQRVSVGRRMASTDRNGALWPRFSRNAPARTISAARVLAGDVDPTWLDGRIVLIGSSLTGLGDIHLTPLRNVATGTAINAQLIASFVAGDTLWRPAMAETGEELLLVVLGIASLALSGRIPLRAQAALVLGTVSLLAALSFAAFSATGILLDWTLPAAGAVLVNLGLGALRVRGDRQARRRAETSLGTALAEIEQARSVVTQALNSTKLATLGEMATVLAHELRQPIATMSMAAENAEAALQDGKLDLSDARARIDRIIAQARRAESMIDHLGIFARADSGNPGPIDLVEAVHDALALIEPSLRRHGIEVTVSCEPDLSPVRAVKVLFEQVVINLCVNARDALSEVAGARRTIDLSLRSAGSVIQLDVADSGPGIPAHALEHLFEPFFTTKPAGVGVGLGLSVCRRIIESFGGTLAARNGAQGAIFTVSVPAMDATPSRADRP